MVWLAPVFRALLMASVRLVGTRVLGSVLIRTVGGLAGFSRSRVGGLGGTGFFLRDLGIKSTIEIDKDDFGGMLHELSHSLKGTPYTIRDIVRGEAASVLGATSRRTKAADKGKVIRRYTPLDGAASKVGKSSRGMTAASRGMTVASARGSGRGGGGGGGGTGGVRQSKELVSSVMLNGKRYYIRKRHSDQMWWLIKLRLREMKETALSRRTADKGAWYAMAKHANLPMTPFVNKMAMDMALNNQWPTFFRSMYGTILNDNIDKYAVEVHSHQESVLNPDAGGIDALRHSMRGRIGYYKQNLKRGVFLHARTIAQKYPNIQVTP